ncbi:MAG: hypothetical protein IJK65_02980 [Clostridiales bacterium]|nr:hypothetical protein [Clostridiales bacterium]
MKFFSEKLHMRSWTRCFSVMLMLCVFSGILTSCSGKGFKKNTIDVPEMARIVADSLDDISLSESLYERIPDDQKDGMTYSEYHEYISVLSNMIPNQGRVLTFEIVEGAEKQRLLEAMLSNDPEEYSDLIMSCIPIKVTTTGVRRSGTPIYFYLQTKPDGTVYLNRSWAKSCMDLYAFSVHYFEAYTNENLTDVISLIPYTETAETLPESEDILREKGKEMIRFYTHNVKSDESDYEMISIDATNLLYLQPEVYDNHLHVSSRQVRFRSDSQDVISVVDPIENELKTADLYLYYNNRRTVRIGDHSAPLQLKSIFGDPLTVSCGPVMVPADNMEDGLRNILIRYKGFSITVYGVYHGEDDWTGTLVHFDIYSSRKVGIGSNMSLNDSSWDVLYQYPFADQMGYELQVLVDGEIYKLKIEFDKENKNEDGSFPIRAISLKQE